jgi:predicted nucleic acid-binding protein
MTVVYDAGALIAADRSDRALWADHRVRLELGVVPSTTAPVVAQASRSARQAQLRRFLRGCEVVSFAAADAHEVGALVGRTARASDVVDAHVVVVAHRRGYAVVTSDERDLRPLVAALGRAVSLIRV